MTLHQRTKWLKRALVLFGCTCLLIYPISQFWPSGWVWQNDTISPYFQMVCGVYAVLGVFLIRAAKAPDDNISLIDFTIWSSIVHAAIMFAQVGVNDHEAGHLVGDIPALLIVAAVLWRLKPRHTLAPQIS